MVVLGGGRFLMSEVPLYVHLNDLLSARGGTTDDVQAFHTVEYDPFIESQLASSQLTVGPHVV